MRDELIVNLCPTGMLPRKKDVPHVPITPEEIARDVRRCRDAGASIVHLHARDNDEEPTWHQSRFQDICDAVATSVPDIIICVTTSGRTWSEVEQRGASLQVDGVGKPEMASLTLGSMNFPTGPSINSASTIVSLAKAMQARQIVPEMEIFDVGMANYARTLVEKGDLVGPFYANILLGSKGTSDLSAINLAAILSGLPQNTTWAVAGVGRFQTAANTLATSLGGHVRVGLEDNPYYDWRDKTPATNPQLVERAVRIGRELGREPATPEQARQMIGLPATKRTG